MNTTKPEAEANSTATNATTNANANALAPALAEGLGRASRFIKRHDISKKNLKQRPIYYFWLIYNSIGIVAASLILVSFFVSVANDSTTLPSKVTTAPPYDPGACGWEGCTLSPTRSMATTTSPSTTKPSRNPTTPTTKPSKNPTQNPDLSTLMPTQDPTKLLSLVPTTSGPSKLPTKKPTGAPTSGSTNSPSTNPTAHLAIVPTKSPTNVPTRRPSRSPTPPTLSTKYPTMVPSKMPTHTPSLMPTKKSPTATPYATFVDCIMDPGLPPLEEEFTATNPDLYNCCPGSRCGAEHMSNGSAGKNRCFSILYDCQGNSLQDSTKDSNYKSCTSTADCAPGYYCRVSGSGGFASSWTCSTAVCFRDDSDDATGMNGGSC